MVTSCGRRVCAAFRLRFFALLALLFTIGVSVGCDKIALTAPTNTTITLFANAQTVPLNGETEVTASVIEPAGTPVQNGTLVTFAANIGNLDPREARTHDGKATVRFLAGQISGTARISAFSGPARATDIEVLVGGTAANRIVLNAAPPSVPSSGGTVEILATVLDAQGNRMSNIPVSFSTSAGALEHTTVTTDGIGEARTRLTTTREATVTATAGAAPAQTVTIRVNAAPTISLAVSTQTPTAGQVVQFTVSTSIGQNGAVVRDVTINFGDGERLSLGALSGSATVSHVYDEDGTYTVTATAIDAEGERTSVSNVVIVQPRTPLVVTLLNDSLPVVGVPTLIRVQVTPTTARIVRYEYDFGDGTTSVLNSPTTEHVYTTPGLKTLRVTAITDDGQRGTGQSQLVVTATGSTAVGR
jgi:PKD repeat protein